MPEPLSDAAWLATRTLAWLADAAFPAPDQHPSLSLPGRAGAVVAPTDIGAVRGAGAATIAAVVGYPTGRHHALIKAAEARLAIQEGAHEAWVCLDVTLSPQRRDNAWLTDLVTIRDACPAPARLALLLAGTATVDEAVARAASASAARAGFDRVVVPAQLVGDWPLEVVAWAPGAGEEEAIAALDAGATFVAV